MDQVRAGAERKIKGEKALKKRMPKFCSFGCEAAENERAQHAACLAVNGVFCGILLKVIEKGTPCPVEDKPAPPKKVKKSSSNRRKL
jgi:hypothetical protein